MEAILKFKLPEERVEHETAVKAMDWFLVVTNLDEWLRTKLKHGHDFKTADDALQAMRDELREECEDRALVLE